MDLGISYRTLEDASLVLLLTSSESDASTNFGRCAGGFQIRPSILRSKRMDLGLSHETLEDTSLVPFANSSKSFKSIGACDWCDLDRRGGGFKVLTSKLEVDLDRRGGFFKGIRFDLNIMDLGLSQWTSEDASLILLMDLGTQHWTFKDVSLVAFATSSKSFASL